jgi:glycogen operon protein
MLNAYWKPLDFELPPPPANKHWRLWIDTHLPSPNDICPWDEAPEVHETNYVVEARSVVMLFEMIGNGLTTTT